MTLDAYLFIGILLILFSYFFLRGSPCTPWLVFFSPQRAQRYTEMKSISHYQILLILFYFFSPWFSVFSVVNFFFTTESTEVHRDEIHFTLSEFMFFLLFFLRGSLCSPWLIFFSPQRLYYPSHNSIF